MLGCSNKNRYFYFSLKNSQPCEPAQKPPTVFHLLELKNIVVINTCSSF